MGTTLPPSRKQDNHPNPALSCLATSAMVYPVAAVIERVVRLVAVTGVVAAFEEAALLRDFGVVAGMVDPAACVTR